MKYLDINRKNHLKLMEFIEPHLTNVSTDEIKIIIFGERTQHIFVKDKYWMTIDWSKV